MNVYSIDIRIVATAYIKAETEEEAQKIANDIKGGLVLPDDVEAIDGPSIFGKQYDHPDMPDLSLSPAMELYGPVEGAEVELVEELVGEEDDTIPDYGAAAERARQPDGSISVLRYIAECDAEDRKR